MKLVTPDKLALQKEVLQHSIIVFNLNVTYLFFFIFQNGEQG